MKGLYFDDDGRPIHPGDFIEVNEEIITMIFEEDGDRYLGGWDGFVETVRNVEFGDDEESGPR